MSEEIKKVITVDTSKGVKSIKSLRDEVSKLTNELEDLEIGSKEYVNKLDDLVDAQKDLTAATESMEGRTVNALKAFDSINQVAGGLAAGISAVSATFTLFGKDTEDLDKVMVKLQASIAIVQGIGGLKGLGEGIINATKAFKALSVSMVAAGTATKGVSVAMKGLKAALVSTGIGALVVVVGMLIEKLLTLKSTASDVSKEVQYSLNNAMNSYNRDVVKANMLDSGAETRREQALADGLKSELEIWKDYQAELAKISSDLFFDFAKISQTYEENFEKILASNKYYKKEFKKSGYGDFSDYARTIRLGIQQDPNLRDTFLSHLTEDQKTAFEKMNEEYDKALQARDALMQKSVETSNKIDLLERQQARENREAIKAENDKKLEDLKNYYDNLKNIVNEGTSQANESLDTNPFKELKAKWQQYYDALSELYEKGEIDVKTYNNTLLKYNEAYTKEYLDVSDERYKTDLENQLAYLQEMQSRESMLFDNQLSNISNKYQGNQRTKVWSGDYYQSTSDVNTEYQNTVNYNNEYLALVTDRINRENDLLSQQQLVLNEMYNAKLITEQEYATQSESISLQLAANEAAIEAERLRTAEANTDAYIALQEKKNQAIQSTISVASSLTGALANVYKQESQDSSKSQKEQEKAFKTYKALAITQAIIDTISSAQGAYKSLVGIPFVGPYLAPVAAAAAVVFGLANVKAIQNEQLAGTSAATSDSGASANVAQEALTLSPVSYTRNLLGDKETDALNQPTKVYVLEQDVTNAQAKVKVTESNASF